jgi:hypothetical protein
LGVLEEKYKYSNKKKGESIMEEWLIKENDEKDFDLFIEHFSKINTNDDEMEKDNEKLKNKKEKFSKSKKSKINKYDNSDNKRDLKITNYFNKKRTFNERNEEEKINNNNSNNNDYCDNYINADANNNANFNYNINIENNEKDSKNKFDGFL